MTATPSPEPDGPHTEPNGAVGGTATTTTGLDPKVAGLLAYLVGWVSGLVLYLIEKEHREVRFHAAQSILVSIVFIGVYIALSILAMVPVIGLVALLGYAVFGLAGFGLWIYLLIQGYNLNHVKLPVLGGLAEQWAAK